MVDGPSEADQLKSFINLQATYSQYLRFTPFENFSVPRNLGMLEEDELAREKLAKTS